MSNFDKSEKKIVKPKSNQDLIEIKEFDTEKRKSKGSYNPLKRNSLENKKENQPNFLDFVQIVFKQFREKIWNKIDDENKICCVCTSFCCCFIFFLLFYTFFIIG